MTLNDNVAQQIMGELDTLTKQIDEQGKRLTKVAADVNNAADQIKVNSDIAVKNASESSRQVQIETAARFQIELSRAVVKTLNEVAGAVATKAAMRWVIAGLLIAGVLTVVAGAVGYSKGQDTGMAESLAAAAWANTPEGRLAFQLAEAGSITALATCDEKRGWKLEKNICHPVSTPAGIYGWRIKK